MKKMEKETEEGDFQQELVLQAAHSKGIKITDVSKEMYCSAAILEYNGQVELLVKGVISSTMNLKIKQFCDHKHLTKNLFNLLNIPSPNSLLFSNTEGNFLKDFITPKTKYVCKPQVAANGIGVETNIISYQQVKDYWERNHDKDNAFLLEEQIEGEDLRIQVINGKIAASCLRIPAYVTGDGIHTLIQLIEARQKIIYEQCPSDSLILDRNSFALMKKQGFELQSIPEMHRHVQLKTVSNIGQGGVAIDVSNEIHPKYNEWIQRIVDFFDASYFALDIICQDHTKDPAKNAFALELNAFAEWTHHTFSERRTHDLGKLVIETTFDL